MSKRLKKVHYVVETTSNWPMAEPYPTLKKAQKRLKEKVNINIKKGSYEIIESSDLHCILKCTNPLFDHWGSKIVIRIYDHIPQTNSGQSIPAWRNPAIKMPLNLEKYGIEKPIIVKDEKIKKPKKK